LKPGIPPSPAPSPPTAPLNPPSNHFIVRGERIAAPPTLRVRNFVEDGVIRFSAAKSRKVATELVIHETVGTSVGDTVATLKRRELGVHLVMGPDGELTQYGDLATDVLYHAKGHNGASFGVEVVNPYYPEQLRPGMPWTRVIDAPWAWKGRYVLPTPAQAEAVAELVRWATTKPAPGIEVPRKWPGVHAGKVRLGRVTEAEGPLPGVLAHQYFGHDDGAWLVLYAWLRLVVGLSQSDAYEEAARRATGVKDAADVQSLLSVA
jgi:hypothetical protein